ncbi:bifunctional glutamate N-acetyltransferase/amino-acid acetyltransferase ArgJ [Sulfoacidibacillus thermotolerans]|uniref:Arginine biosynthesis bifunctional protein ArgJ n=1 Tax=Sulfoacidibacillus thermotolerans TaxID=1765684 RepID=A0A2U3D8R2_SULT2|nr:bifunctional glutamate N-acetyltransferase/amino-acid acetyltransferase ArgJ [Sulfoacidibacillus thermotolerans]PWI57666.1 bifunctional ornithine acetyltransferase/N-acetylglutamate synthase [Sulfoacidibacillus thermotolerans]
MDMPSSISITAVPGISCASGYIGIKRDERPDAALFICDQKAAYAGVFTTNQFRSACVESALERLHGGKQVKAVLITSGNANAGTGLAGRADTELLAAGVAEQLDCQADEVIVLHTGVIGVPMHAERLLPRLRNLVAAADRTSEAGIAAATAMMTTDTFPKTSVRAIHTGQYSGMIGGVAKGAGMIHPRLATMLSLIVTDLPVHPVALQRALVKAVKPSFNAISVDGDTSPNDSVILLATGTGTEVITEQSKEFSDFCDALTEVAQELAKMIVKDGEGATKFIEIEVQGGATEADVERVASTVATSPLVKTAFYGEDFNPGRIVSAIGRSGAHFVLNHLTLQIGGITVFVHGAFTEVDEQTAKRVMSQSEIVVVIDLAAGSFAGRYFTCDLTHDYVQINSEYTT